MQKVDGIHLDGWRGNHALHHVRQRLVWSVLFRFIESSFGLITRVIVLRVQRLDQILEFPAAESGEAGCVSLEGSFVMRERAKLTPCPPC